MQTITSATDTRGRAGKQLLATVDFFRCAALVPSATHALVTNTLWNRTVKLPLLGLPGSFSAYPIPYEWSVATGATDETEQPASVVQNKLSVNFFTVFTRSILKQWHSLSQSNLNHINRSHIDRSKSLTHKHNRLVSKQFFDNKSPAGTPESQPIEKTPMSIIKSVSSSVLQKYFAKDRVAFATATFFAADIKGKETGLAKSVSIDSHHDRFLLLQDKNKPIAILQALLRQGSVTWVKTAGDGNEWVNKALKTMTARPAGFAVFMSEQKANPTQRLLTKQRSISNTSAVEYLKQISAASDAQRANQPKVSNQPVQQLIRSLMQQGQTQNSHARQQSRQQQQTLEVIERQFHEASQYNYRELQNLQRSLQELKGLFNQKKQQLTVIPRIKPPSFFRPL